jgi:hypothetical protein
MPPRYTYWTIILEGKPTAFRARTEEELLPTLKQLQARHPDAVLKWFSRGKLWHSQEEERLARAARDATREKRGRDWRPGGTHRDPRERFQIPRDERRRRFRERLIRDRSQTPPQPPGEPQPPNENDHDRRQAPPRRQPSSAEAKRPWKPSSERKGPWKPSRDGEGKRPWKPKEQRPWKPAGPGGRPAGPGGRPPRRSFGGPGKPGGGRRGGGGGGGGQGGPRGGGRGGGGRGGGGRGGGPR